MKNIVCMKWGTLYSAEYVNKLYSMVKRNITGEFRFVCLTDDDSGLDSNIETRECPVIDIPAPYNNHGGWRKLTLWNSALFEKGETWLFFDLDVVIVDNIDELFSYKESETFVVMQNWTQPNQNIGNTSVFRFKVGVHDYIYHEFLENYDKIIHTKETRNEQIYISRRVKSMTFWPDEWCVLFKVQSLPPVPLRYYQEAKIPQGSKVIAFPGVPNPHQAQKGEWPAPWYKKFYKTLLPVSWIEKHWRY